MVCCAAHSSIANPQPDKKKQCQVCIHYALGSASIQFVGRLLAATLIFPLLDTCIRNCISNDCLLVTLLLLTLIPLVLDGKLAFTDDTPLLTAMLSICRVGQRRRDCFVSKD
jgi:hypothetical protein